jgi:hypothetical protein
MYMTRLGGTAMLVLTIAAVLSTACTKSNDNAGTTGTSGTGIRVSHIDLGRSVSVDKTIGGSTDSFKPNDTIYASIATEGSAPTTEGALDLPGRTGRQRIDADDRAHRRRQNRVSRLEAGWMAGRKVQARSAGERVLCGHEGLRGGSVADRLEARGLGD